MAPPTPSLARLSLVARTGAPPPAQKPKRDKTTIAEFSGRLPPELWDYIVTLVINNNECANLEQLCDAEGMPWSGWCEDGLLYEWVSARLGWYGDLPDWEAVKAHYQEGRAWAKRQGRLNVPTEAKDPKAYFRDVCARRQRIWNLSRSYRTSMSSYVDIMFGSRMSERVGDRMRYWYPPYAVSLAKYAVSLNWSLLERVPGSVQYGGTFDAEWGTIDGYAEIAKVAVHNNGIALKYVPGSINARTGEQKLKCIDGYAEIAKIALEQNGLALCYVPGSLVPLADHDVPLSDPLEQYAELAKVAVHANGFALKYVPGSINARTGVRTREWIEEYAELAEVAVVANGAALRYVPPSHSEYATIAEVAMEKYPLVAASLVNWRACGVEARARIAKMAVDADPHLLAYVPSELPNYKLLAELAIKRSPDVIMYVPVTHPDHDALEALAEREGANPKYTT